MKIIDSFMFFDEDMMLDLRLNILDKYISKFIICESTYNHNGQKKKLNFDLKKFSKFKSKIDYIVLDKEPNNLRTISENDSRIIKENKTLDNALLRENFQRNYAYKKLLEFHDNDLILINDLDEIPNLKNFNYNKKVTVFKQKMLYFKLNLMYKNLSWVGSKICKKKDLISPQWLRNIKARKYPIWRFDIVFSKKKYNDIEIIDEGGWHFTNIKTAEQISHKMKSYLHHYEFEESNMNVSKIKELINNKKTLYDYKADKRQNKWNNNVDLEKIKLNLLPEFINKNKSKYLEWID